MTYGLHLGLSLHKIEFEESKKREFLGKLQNEYAINLYSGYLWKNDKKYQKINKTFKDGDIVEMILENGTLSFKNGFETFVAFNGIYDCIYPAATVIRKGDCLDLLSIQKI